MKKRNILLFSLSLAAMVCSTSACAQKNLKDLLGGAGSTITNLVEGVFSRSDLKVEDLTGEWISDGPAVCFQSDNMLKKAGGVAAAAALESKLEPYYKQYGLNGATLSVDKAGNFTMKVKALSLKGTIKEVANEKGVFTFSFNVMGMNIGNMKTYVQKTSGSMDIMFDATKLKQLISAIANLTGNKMAQTLGTLLDSYEGLCVGFNMRLTSAPASSGTNSNSKTGKDSTNKSSNGSNNIDQLFDILKSKTQGK